MSPSTWWGGVCDVGFRRDFSGRALLPCVKKHTLIIRPLRLRRQTVQIIGTDALPVVAGGQKPRTITCNEECDSYACTASLC